MASMDASVTINKPVEKVFAFFSDPANNTRWQGGLSESKQISPGVAGVGTKMQDTRDFLGQKLTTPYEITEYEANKKVSFKSSGGPITYAGTFTFASAGGGTQVSAHFDFEVGGAFKIAEGMVVSQAQKQFDGDFAKLKQMLEAM